MWRDAAKFFRWFMITFEGCFVETEGIYPECLIINLDKFVVKVQRPPKNGELALQLPCSRDDANRASNFSLPK